MILGRQNALEFDRVDGAPIARRYVVYTCEIRNGAILSVERADEPAETVALPLHRDVASVWLLANFEDLEPDDLRALLARLTRPIAGRQ